ncbi:hypothetical protein MTO96_007588 [Rhipicephalus appendiculatus]
MDDGPLQLEKRVAAAALAERSEPPPIHRNSAGRPANVYEEMKGRQKPQRSPLPIRRLLQRCCCYSSSLLRIRVLRIRRRRRCCCYHERATMLPLLPGLLALRVPRSSLALMLFIEGAPLLPLLLLLYSFAKQASKRNS